MKSKQLLAIALTGLVLYKAHPLYGTAIKQGKNGVRIKVIRPEIMQAIEAGRAVFNAHGEKFTITDWWRNDPNSLHYYHLAIDARANHLNASKRNTILDAWKRVIGNAYELIVHGSGAMIHYHLEYDPLRRGVAPFKGR